MNILQDFSRQFPDNDEYTADILVHYFFDQHKTRYTNPFDQWQHYHKKQNPDFCVWLTKMPTKNPSREQRIKSKLYLRSNASFFSRPQNSNITLSLNHLILPTKQNFSPALPTLFAYLSILQNITTSWLLEQSELLWTMQQQPSRITSFRVRNSTKVVSGCAFY